MKKEFIQRFREIIRIFEREIFLQNNASCCYGISLAQCHALLEIEKHSDISVSELSQNLKLDKSTISRTVEGLVNMGMVDRVVPKENRRMAKISLTGNGTEVCVTINHTNNSYIRNILRDFSEGEREEFLRLFSKLTCNMVTARKA